MKASEIVEKMCRDLGFSMNEQIQIVTWLVENNVIPKKYYPKEEVQKCPTN